MLNWTYKQGEIKITNFKLNLADYKWIFKKVYNCGEMIKPSFSNADIAKIQSTCELKIWSHLIINWLLSLKWIKTR